MLLGLMLFTDLNVVMQDKQSRTELLKALELGTPYNEYVVITDSASWTVLPGSMDWSSTTFENLAESQTSLVETKRRVHILALAL